MSPALERVGVMVIRIWTEGRDSQLRARLTHTLDIAARNERSDAMTSPEQVLKAVSQFVDAFLEDKR